MYRTSLESVLKNIDTRKQKTFEFADHYWSAPIFKKFLATFEGQEVTITLEEIKGNAVMLFKWKNGNAHINCSKRPKV